MTTLPPVRSSPASAAGQRDCIRSRPASRIRWVRWPVVMSVAKTAIRGSTNWVDGHHRSSREHSAEHAPPQAGN